DELLRLVDEADRRDIARLVQYPQGSVGSVMTTEYAWLPANITVEQAIDRLRVQAPDKETIYYIFVVDAQDRPRPDGPVAQGIVPEPGAGPEQSVVLQLGRGRQLLGVVSLRELIMAPRRTILADVMSKDVVTVKATDDQEAAAKLLAHYDLLAIPV